METDAGMPDVSQIVPLANAFGVRTDVLFGLEGRDEGGEVQEIIRSAYRLIDGPNDRDGLLRCYQALLEGLKRYPCQPALLLQALEAGASLAYPENACYDGENGRRIYLECVKQLRLWSSDTPEAPPTFCARICCWCCCMRRMAIRKPQKSTRSSSRCGRI